MTNTKKSPCRARLRAPTGIAATLAAGALCAAMSLFTAGVATAQSTFPVTVNPKAVITAVPNSTYPVMGIDFLSDGRMVVLTTRSTGNNILTSNISPAHPDHALYLVSGLTRNGNMQGATWTKILDSLTGNPPGVLVVNDTVYVMDRTAFYRVKSLSPVGGTAKSKNAIRIINAPSPDSGLDWSSGAASAVSNHQWMFTPQYHAGRFYAAYSGTLGNAQVIGGRANGPPSSTLSGAVLSWLKDSVIANDAPANAGYTREAGGLRSPNGMGTNGMGIMLIADNQGAFTPGNPVYLYSVGQPLVTYGYRQATEENAGSWIPGNGAPWNTVRNWAEDLPYQPPVIWIPDNTAQSLSQPLYMDRGPYRGDWIVGDVNAPALGRLHLDNVDNTGKYQASYHLFTSGIDSPNGTSPGKAINRLAWSPDSAIYVGTILNRGDWPAGSAGPMTRISLRDTAVFEILAVRSRKAPDGILDGVEIEFSMPVDSTTISAENFALRQTSQVRSAFYGCVVAYPQEVDADKGGPPCTFKTIVPTGTTISHDRTKVFVAIPAGDTSIGAAHIGTLGTGNNPRGVWGGPGKQDRGLRIIVSPALTSETGAALLYGTAYLGWNYQSQTAFSGKPLSVARNHPTGKYLSSAVASRVFPGLLHVRVNLPGKRFTVSLHTVTGTLLEERAGSGGGLQEFTFDTRALARGVHVLKVKSDGAVYSRAVSL